MNEGQIILIHSLAWKNAFLRMDGTNINSPVAAGGGIVNCQFYDTSKFAHEDWKATIGAYEKIIVHVTPSGLYSFESYGFRKRYLRLVGTDGAKANLQYWENPPTDGSGSYELFKYNQLESGEFALESNQFPGYYVQLHGSSVTAQDPNGLGSITSSLGTNAETTLMGLIYQAAPTAL